MSNDEITKDKVIEIVTGDEPSSQNQESIKDGITEDDAVDSPQEFQWKKYVFVAIMLIMVWFFFFKTENVYKQEKTDYGIKTSTTQYEVESNTQYEAESSTQIEEPLEIIKKALSEVEEKKTIAKGKKINSRSEKEFKADSEKKVKIKADSENADIKTDSSKDEMLAPAEIIKQTLSEVEEKKPINSGSEKEIKIKAYSENSDIKGDSSKDEMLEIVERKTEEEAQQKNELEEEKRKLEDEKKETEKIQKKAKRKKCCYGHGAFWFAIGVLLIITWHFLGYGCCGSRPGWQNNIWSKLLAWIRYENTVSPKYIYTTSAEETKLFLWKDAWDYHVFVSGLVFMSLGLAILLITFIAYK